MERSGKRGGSDSIFKYMGGSLREWDAACASYHAGLDVTAGLSNTLPVTRDCPARKWAASQPGTPQARERRLDPQGVEVLTGDRSWKAVPSWFFAPFSQRASISHPADRHTLRKPESQLGVLAFLELISATEGVRARGLSCLAGDNNHLRGIWQRLRTVKTGTPQILESCQGKPLLGKEGWFRSWRTVCRGKKAG